MTNSEGSVPIHTNEPDLLPKILEFIQSATYEEKEKLIQNNPDLLGQETDYILAQIEQIWKDAGDDDMYQSIATWREFLNRVAEADFEIAVLEGTVYQVIMEIPDSFAGEYLSKITALHPELLNKRADEAIIAVRDRLMSEDDDLSEDDDPSVFNELMDQILAAVLQVTLAIPYCG